MRTCAQDGTRWAVSEVDAVFVGIIGDDGCRRFLRDTAIGWWRSSTPPKATVPAAMKWSAQMPRPTCGGECCRSAKASEPCRPSADAQERQPGRRRRIPVLLHAVSLLECTPRQCCRNCRPCWPDHRQPALPQPAMPGRQAVWAGRATTMAEAAQRAEGRVVRNRSCCCTPSARWVPIRDRRADRGQCSEQHAKCEPVEYRPSILETLGTIGPSARPPSRRALAEPAIAQRRRPPTIG